MTKERLMKEEIISMHRGIFKKHGEKYKVIIPNDVVDYINRQDKTNTWKGKCLLTYVGIYLAYREAFYTYRERNMNIYNIMDLMGVSPDNRAISSQFTKKSYFSKQGYITHINDLPYSYSIIEQEGKKQKKIKYNMASDLSNKERNEIFIDFSTRQMRAIEPTINIKGKTRIRGRGIEIISYPLDEKWKDCISFCYDTIYKFVSNRLSAAEFWALAQIKQMTWNKSFGNNSGQKFNTSKARIAERIGITENGYKKTHLKLTSEFGSKFSLNQVVTKKDGTYSSKTYLNIDKDI